MANDRISQLPVEVLVLPNPPGRLSQLAVEVLVLAREIPAPFISATTTFYAPSVQQREAIEFIAATTVVYQPTVRRASIAVGFLASSTHVFPPRLVRPLTNVSLPAISGTPRQGQQVTASPGVWSGTEPIFYSYQWRRCNSGGGACVDIAGATSSVYVVQAADIGGTLRIVVTASN